MSALIFLDSKARNLLNKLSKTWCRGSPKPPRLTINQTAWAYIQASQPSALYFYSKYERTIYRNLAERYPEVCSRNQIDELFACERSIDLYNDVVKKKTEWPTRDYSIKTLAQYLGFKWKDSHPSGAASIEWFYRWNETGDPEIRKRILEYNEDDCRATRWLLDGIKSLRLVSEVTQ